MPSMPQLLIILLIVILLFGAKKIPDLAKGLGSGIKNFKKAIKDEEEQTNHTEATATKPDDKATANKIEGKTEAMPTNTAQNPTSNETKVS